MPPVKKRRLKIPFAVKGGSLVHVSEVNPGAACGCTCIDCGSGLLAKKGAQRVHHFAHEHEAPCSDESVLHKLAKEILRRRIEQSLQTQSPLILEWSCGECHDTHRVDMLKKADRVAVEHSLGLFKPDLTLFNQHARPYLGIEVIVTHAPERSAVDGYTREKMTRIEFAVKDAKALEGLAGGDPLHATYVSHCIAPKCACGGILYPRHIYIHDVPCWKCGEVMKAAYMYYSFGPDGPDKFRPEEIHYARRKGVVLERRFSKTVHRSYLANVCAHCGNMWGRHFTADASKEILPGTSEAVLLECFQCHKAVPRSR